MSATESITHPLSKKLSRYRIANTGMRRMSIFRSVAASLTLEKSMSVPPTVTSWLDGTDSASWVLAWTTSGPSFSLSEEREAEWGGELETMLDGLAEIV